MSSWWARISSFESVLSLVVVVDRSRGARRCFLRAVEDEVERGS